MSDLVMRRGDNRRFSGVVQRPDANGVLQLVDISLVTDNLWFSVKRKREDADPAVIQKTNIGNSDGGIEKTDPTNGAFDVKLVPGDTDSFTIDELFEYDVQLVSVAFGVETIDSGTLRVNLDVSIPIA